MLKTIKTLTIVILSFGFDFTFGQFTVPKTLVEPLTPKGLRLSMPHQPGLSLVTFHVKINEDFDDLEDATIAGDAQLIRDRQDRWIYQDTTVKLKLGDIVYYRIHVVLFGQGNTFRGLKHQVSKFRGINDSLCISSETKLIDLRTSAMITACAGQLLLDEQFDHFNQSLWRKQERFTSSPDFAFVVYRNDERNVRISDGNLVIQPTLVKSEFGEKFILSGKLTLKRCTGKQESTECQRKAFGPYILPPVFSGLINTKDRFAFTYGKVRIRAKFPQGDWIYPVIQLESPDEFPYEHRLRVASSNGNLALHSSDNKDYSGAVLWSGPIGESFNDTGFNFQETAEFVPWSEGYHVYELEWRKEKIIFRVDGEEFRTIEMNDLFHEPLSITLGVAVGGVEEFPDDLISEKYSELPDIYAYTDLVSTYQPLSDVRGDILTKFKYVLGKKSGAYTKPWKNKDDQALFNFYKMRHLWSNTWYENSSSLKIDYIKVWALE